MKNNVKSCNLYNLLPSLNDRVYYSTNKEDFNHVTLVVEHFLELQRNLPYPNKKIIKLIVSEYKRWLNDSFGYHEEKGIKNTFDKRPARTFKKYVFIPGRKNNPYVLSENGLVDNTRIVGIRSLPDKCKAYEPVFYDKSKVSLSYKQSDNSHTI